MHPRAAELVATLSLRPHPEGGFYREVLGSTSVVAPADARGRRRADNDLLPLTEGSISRWHQVDSDEVWHFYEGEPIELLQLEPSWRMSSIARDYTRRRRRATARPPRRPSPHDEPADECHGA